MGNGPLNVVTNQRKTFVLNTIYEDEFTIPNGSFEFQIVKLDSLSKYREAKSSWGTTLNSKNHASTQTIMNDESIKKKTGCWNVIH